MTRFNQILIGLFALQLVAAVGIEFADQPRSANAAKATLLTVDSNQIDRIVITNSKSKEAVLSKQDGKWLLPDDHKLPANQSLVEKIITSLKNTRSGWPVATTDSSIDRFKVADNDYEIRITLAKGNSPLETLYLGTSPGFRQLHLRRGGEDKVYTVKLNDYDFPADNKYWLDKTLLQPKQDIAEIKGPDFTIDKQGDTWKLAGTDSDVKKDEVKKLVDAVANLSVKESADKKESGKAYTLKVKTENNNISYDFFKDGGNYYVKRNDNPQAFRISKGDYEKITGETATRLVKHADSEKSSDKQHASANTETATHPLGTAKT
jgi:hypothetical protein